MERMKGVFAYMEQEVEELNKAHLEQQANLMVDMKKEMAAMQRKILLDCVSMDCLLSS